MEEKYFVWLLFMVIIAKRVYSVNSIDETTAIDVSSLSVEAYTDEITSNTQTTYANTTERDGINENYTQSFNETTTYDLPTTTVEITTIPTTPNPTARPTILPKMREAFQAKVRLSKTSHPMSTYEAVVSYDLKKNRAAITKQDSKNKNRKIYDFNLNRVLNIRGDICLVEDIPDNSTEDLAFPFPFSIIDGAKQLNGPLSVFRLDGNDTKMAEEGIFVSGIPCTEYFKTIDIGSKEGCKSNVKCKIRQFFSNSEWKNPNCKDVYCTPMPVRIDVECDFTPTSCYYLKLVFSVLEFYEEIKNEEEFQQLPGIYCENIASEPFPALSSSVHVTIKEKDLFKNTLRNRKVWWSNTLNVLRVDEVIDDGDVISLITDYNANISYTITKLDTECKTKISDQEQPSALSLLISTEKKYIKGMQKVGKRRCELLECEVWTGETVSGDSFDIYLNTRSQSSEGDFVPVVVDLFRKNEVLELYSRRKFTNYIPALAESSAFDVSPCFEDIRKTPFELTITGAVGEKWTNPSFRENIYNKIWNYSRLITPLRLQNFQIVPETNETITVKAVIIDFSSEKNNKDGYKDITSEDALENIQTMIKKEDVFAEEGYQLKVADFKVERPTPKPGCKKYGPGDMGGLAIGMILVGTILGSVLFFMIKRRK